MQISYPLPEQPRNDSILLQNIVDILQSICLSIFIYLSIYFRLSVYLFIYLPIRPHRPDITALVEWA